MKTALISALTVHPLLQAIPMLEESDPQSKAVIASVCELGILEPLKVSKGRVVDGRLRMRGAIAAGLETVAVIEVPEEDIASIILQSLAARRHFTKSALAYLSAPILEAALAESRKRAINAARNGVSAFKSNPISWGYANTIEAMAERLGVCERLLESAISLHKKFKNYPNFRTLWEPKILSGEISLGEVQQAISGKLAGMNGQTTPKGNARQLLFDLFNTATVRFGRWDTLSASERKEIAAKFRTEFLPSLPPELLEEARHFEGAISGN